MLLLGALVLLSITFFCLKRIDSDYAESAFVGAVFGGILSISIVTAIIIDIAEIATSYTIDWKIEMYEEENSVIETRIDSIVQAYMNYESETFEDYRIENTEDAMTLVSVFPELKSDSVVQQQIELYVANNDRIKELKEEKIDIKKLKWELYFGH